MTGVPEPVGRNGGELDGFRIGYLPPAVGDLVSDFASEWEGVSLATRVWERQVEDGHRVDLRVHVLRGDRLGTLVDLRDFLAEYHERDNADSALTTFSTASIPASSVQPRRSGWPRLVWPSTCWSIRSGSPRMTCGPSRRKLRQLPQIRQTAGLRRSARPFGSATARQGRARKHEGTLTHEN